ncbi:MAG: hypothetical protein QXV37_03560 [Candidatus Jordarchaeaceae archaeon]
MPESPEHLALKACASRIFSGRPEKAVNGRVDVKAPRFCVEVETSGKTDRLEHAINKLSSSTCGGGFLVVPPKALDKAMKLTESKRNIIPIPSDKFKKICKIHS